MRSVLVSTYEMGRQPFGLASPAAWLRAAGWTVTCVDTAKEPLTDETVASAHVIAFHLPMHTATRLAAPMIVRVRRAAPSARLCAYGLYAPLNEAWLQSPPQVVAGSALTAFGDRLVCGDALRVPLERARADSLGWLAAAGLARGDAVAADRALPVYLRDKVALTTAEREAAKLQRDAASGGA